MGGARDAALGLFTDYLGALPESASGRFFHPDHVFFAEFGELQVAVGTLDLGSLTVNVLLVVHAGTFDGVVALDGGHEFGGEEFSEDVRSRLLLRERGMVHGPGWRIRVQATGGGVSSFHDGRRLGDGLGSQLWAEADCDEFLGRGDAVVGLEAFVGPGAVHDIGVEADHLSTVVGDFPGVLGEFGARSLEFGGGFGVGCDGTLRFAGASSRHGCAGLYVILEFFESYLDEFSGGVHAVARLEFFQSALCDGHEELHDSPSAVGFFGDNLGESFSGH